MPTIPRNYEEARELADKARDLAYERRDRARLLESAHRSHQRAGLREYWWQFWRPTTLPLSIPFDKAVDRRVANDPEYNGAIKDNQWYIQYATMYAQREVLAELRKREPDVYLDLGETEQFTASGLPRRVPAQ